MRSLVCAAAVALLLGVSGAPVPAAPVAPALPRVPEGWSVTESESLAGGVERHRLVRAAPAVVAHVARIPAGSPVRLRAVLSGGQVVGPSLERTSAMCRRVGCVVAVNADFHTPAGEPFGGMVVGRRAVRSPSPVHHRVAVRSDATLAAGQGGWSVRVMPSDLRPLQVTGVNVARGADALVVYTPDHGSATGTNAHGTEVVLRSVSPGGAAVVGHTAMVEVVGRAAGGSAIPADGAVLSGHGAGAAALADLLARIDRGEAGPRLLVRVEDADGAVVESVGGTPVLLREGRVWVAPDGTSFSDARHPRTAVGWTPGGDVLLVVVDGRQATSAGLTLVELAGLLAGLGASEALNLDGGGSSTFVRGGQVVSSPSDRLVRRGRGTAVVPLATGGEVVVGHVERPVVSALAVVPAPGAGVGAAPSLPDGLTVDPRLPQALAAPADPASAPGSSAPALLPAGPAPAPGAGAPTWVLVAATVLLAGVARAVAGRLRAVGAEGGGTLPA